MGRGGTIQQGISTARVNGSSSIGTGRGGMISGRAVLAFAQGGVAWFLGVQ